MNIEQIKEMAKKYNIKAGKARKGDLVRAIQDAEGNDPCFYSNSSDCCGQDSCLWRDDCV